MAEAIIVFIFMSWLLVTLGIYWFKNNMSFNSKNNQDKEIDSKLDKILEGIDKL